MVKKNLLVIGGGGREHALCWKLSKSKKVGKIYAIPGNAGIAEIAECRGDIKATDIEKILDFVDEHKDIYMTVVAPDDPLAMGLVDELEKRGYRAFGPRKDAALIESSKIFSKTLMNKYKIPTAGYKIFDNYGDAMAHVMSCRLPVVIKADGLTLGKGVRICDSREEAAGALRDIMLDKEFGSAGDKVVIEDYLNGFEVSMLAFTDGTTVIPAASCRDYKRANDFDTGLNTGGMGSYSPVPAFTEKLWHEAYNDIMVPTIKAMDAELKKFKGVLYFGLMCTDEGIKVLEYNARFGDPETQAILPRLETDLFDIFEAVIDEKLEGMNIAWSEKPSVCVIAASGGYPSAYEKGKHITIETPLDKNVLLFHAGTEASDKGLVTSGGRVIGVTALGKTLAEAREIAYKNIEKIKFEGMFYRNDICKF